MKKVAAASVALCVLLISSCLLFSPGHVLTYGRAIHAGPGTSTNWSGYVVETSLASPRKGAVYDVKGSWVVPSVDCQHTPDAEADLWIGIDGWSSRTVEQIGVGCLCFQGWAPIYYAWYEMFPENPVVITSIEINSGDRVSAEVRYSGSMSTRGGTSGDMFQLTITDDTTGATFTTTQTSKTADRSSAEWIAEAPGIPTVALAEFLTVTFQDAQATLNVVHAGPTNLHTGPISDSAWQYDRLNMVSSSGSLKAATSALSGTKLSFGGRTTFSGTSFSVEWYAAQ